MAFALATLGFGRPASASTSIENAGGVEIIIARPDDTTVPRIRRRERSQPPGAQRAARVAAVRTRTQPDTVESATLSYAGQFLRLALAYVGVPYVWGGQSPLGFDCSGYVWYAYSRVGIRIPRTADLQFAAGRAIAGDPLPGDLVFFQTYDYGASHVGIYLGEGRFVNAIGTDVHVTSFASEYFRSRYLGARRFLPD